MNAIKHNILSFFGLLCLTALFVSACTDDTDYSAIPDDMKLFRPSTITVVNGETQAIVRWPNSLFTNAGEVSYELQIAKDNAFTNPVISRETKASEITISDNEMEIKVPHFARIRALGRTPDQHSEWVISTAFQITGEQIFLPVLDNDVSTTSVLLRWRQGAAPTKIVLTDPANVLSEYPISAAERASSEKLIEGLAHTTAFTAEIFQNNVSKGITTFTTREPSIFDIIITPNDDFKTTVENAADGSIIGLQPGTYQTVDGTGAFATVNLSGKTVSIRSVSNDPGNTKVIFREFTFTGTGAGASFYGITFEANSTNGDYFMNFAGGAAQFTHVIVENCIVENVRVSFLRANRAGNNEHKIVDIIVKNSWLRNHLVNNYHVFHLDKLEFQNLEISNSTFSNLGSRGFIGWTTNIPMPATPKIRVDHVTINGLGSSNRNDVLLDCNANNIDFVMTNSIIVNMPLDGNTVGSRLIRSNTNPTQLVLSHSNLFNLTTGGATPSPITIIGYVNTFNLLNFNPGWTQSSSNMSLPAGSALRTASTTGGPLGDLRWAF
jgi:hypothetical protein